jgi:hypothetical protein
MEDFDGHTIELRLDKAGSMEARKVWDQRKDNDGR